MHLLGEDIRAIWIATNHRTGSMWATNVVAAIVRAEGHPVVPERQGEADERARTIMGLEHLRGNAKGVAVIKTHDPVPLLPSSVGVITRRDVRDATVSWMRFMRRSFARSVSFARNALARTPEKLFAGEHRILLDHELIAENPVEAVRYLARQLGAATAEQAAAEIAAQFSKAVVSKIAAEADARVMGRLAAGGKVLRNELVVLETDNWRARDLETSFQTGHVSDYRTGDWKHILTATQQDVLNELIEAAGHSMV